MLRTNLFFLFVVVPIIEIALLVQVGQMLGFWPTIGLVVLTAAVGSSIAAREGTAALNGLSQAGVDTISTKLADAAIILVCGFLLLTPGILTDVVGLLGLFPLTRPVVRNFVLKQFGKRVQIQTFGAFGGSQGQGRQATSPSGNEAPGNAGPVIGGQASSTPRHARNEDLP